MRSKYTPEECDAIVNTLLDYTFSSGTTYKARVFACHPDIGLTIVSAKYQHTPEGHFDKDEWLLCNHLALSPLRREIYKDAPHLLNIAIKSFDALVTEIISTGEIKQVSEGTPYEAMNPCAFR